MEYQNCPNCNASIKSGVFNSNPIIHSGRSNFIRTYSSTKSEAYCSKCHEQPYNEASKVWKERSTTLNNRINELTARIPVISLQNPYDWKYRIIDMVSAQTVTGTGVLSEISSSFSDFFGMQSNKLNSKIKAGENQCKHILRLSAVDCGANAVIATDIDYAEVGGDKGMLMVCMAGTAVKIENPEVLGECYPADFKELTESIENLNSLNQFKEIVSQY